MKRTDLVRSLLAAAFLAVLVPLPAAEAAAPRPQGAHPMSQVVGVRKPAAKAGVCSVPAPAASVSPAPVVFPVTLRDTNSAPVPFAIQNVGTGNLLVTGFSVDNPPCDCPLIFDVTDPNTCIGTTLPPGGSCTAYASFLAYGSSGYTWVGAINVITNDPLNPVLAVPVEGTIGQGLLQLSTSSLDFGGVAVGTPVTLPLGVTNNGTVPVNITGSPLYGIHAALYSVAPGPSCAAFGGTSFPFALPAGASCDLAVTFQPQGIGVFSNAFTYVAFNDGANSDSEYVGFAGAGIGVGGAIQLEPASVNFFSIYPGEQSYTAFVTVRNLDSAAHVFTGAATSPSPPFFVDASACGGTIPAGGSCVLQVWADATAVAAGIYSGVIEVTTDLGITPLGVGVDVVPNLAWNPYSIDFPLTAAGSTSTVVFTLENHDPVPYTISLTALTPPFAITGGTCQAGTIPPASGGLPGTCTASVSFTPTIGGSAFATNVIATESTTGSPIYGYAYGEGFNPGPVVRLDSSSVRFPPGLQGVPAQASVVATNLGNQATPGGLVFTSSPSPDVTVDPGTCAAPLGVGASCTFTVNYSRATVNTDPFSNLATVAVEAGALPQAFLDVYGLTFATLPATIEAYPADTLSFPPTPVGSSGLPLEVSLGNTGLGGAGLEIFGIASSSPDFVVSSDCPLAPSQLASQACCLVSVGFQPTAGGVQFGTLTVTTSTGEITITLVGEGILPDPPGVAVTFTPPSVPVGQPSTLTVTLSNTNLFPLTNVNLLDPFPPGLQVAATPAVTNTCGGAVTATAGGNTLGLANGVIGAGTLPAADRAKAAIPATCEITVAVVATQSGTITNTIPAGNVTAAETAAAGVTSAAASGSLVATGAQALPTALSFTPGTVAPNVPSRFDINVGNPNPANFVDPDSFTYNLPAGLVIANPANAGLIGTACSGAISAAAPGATSFTLAGFGVATGGACDFQVDVVASAPGSYAATLAAGLITGTVLSEPVANAAPATSPVTLTVTVAPAPVLALAPAAPGPIDFGQVTVGSSSSPWPVQVTNAGNAPLSFSGAFGITGDYSLASTTCGTTLPAPPDPASSCVANLVFTPTAIGVRGGAFSVASNGGNATLNLTGEGLAQPVATIALSPASLVFASQTIGTPSAPQQVTVTSAGTAPLAITGITVTGDFAVSSPCTSLSPLAPSATCPISVTFTPLLAGTRVGQVTVASNDPSAPAATVSLSGAGIAAPAPNVSLSPTVLSFPSTAAGQASAPLSATLANTGAAVLTISAVELVGSGFGMSSDCGGRSLATGETCTITAVFTPPAAGSFAADVRIASNSPAGAAFLKLTGSATPAPTGRFTATPAQLAFGDQVLRTSSAPQTLTLANTGAAVASVSRIDVTGDFALEGACYDVRPGESCVLRVTFTPGALGARTGQVIVTSNASNAAFAVGLSGTGVPVPAPRVQLSASSLAWGNTVSGTGSAQSVTLTNVGSLDLLVGSVTATGDFRVSSGCAGTVAPGQSCRLEVSFVPTIPGTRTGEVRISTNAEGSPHGVSLSGTGCRFSISGRNPALVCAP